MALKKRSKLMELLTISDDDEYTKQVEEYMNQDFTQKSEPPVKDLKAGVGRKAPVGYLSPASETYAARGFQYGEEKYAMGNYLRSPPESVSDLIRLFEYACALKRHTNELCNSILQYVGEGRKCPVSEQQAAFAPDAESKLPKPLEF